MKEFFKEPETIQTVEKKMKVWITKYALTTGIIEIEIVNESNDKNTIFFLSTSGHMKFYTGKDWHTSLTAATLRFDQMLGKKIISAEKALKKLKNMDVKVVKRNAVNIEKEE